MKGNKIIVPKKIFYMVYSLTSGGIEKYSINLFKYIDKTKFRLDFITKIDRKEFFDQQLYALGGNKIPLAKKYTNSRILILFELFVNAVRVSRRGYDIGYFNLSSPSDVFKYPLICRISGIKKIVVHSHNSSNTNHRLSKRIANWLGRIVINIISSEKFACSDKAAEWMYGARVVKNKSYTFVQNGLEVDKYLYNARVRDENRQKLGLSSANFVIGHIGRFENQKNHRFLINIFEAFLKNDKSAKLVLIGVGSLKKEIEQLVLEKHLQNSVLFLGERNNVNELLQVFDVFVLPSLFEGLPIVGVEAQAAGLKCVFADTITKEADITGNVSFLSLADSVKAWVNEIESFKNYQRKNQLQALVGAGYDISSTAKLVQSKLDQVLLDTKYY